MLDDIVVSLTLVVLVSFIPLDARARMLSRDYVKISEEH